MTYRDLDIERVWDLGLSFDLPRSRYREGPWFPSVSNSTDVICLILLNVFLIVYKSYWVFVLSGCIYSSYILGQKYKK